MAQFAYKAVDASGRQSDGTVAADSARAARTLLRTRGLQPLDITDTIAAGANAGSRWRPLRLAESDLALLTRQWATLLASGLTMEQALSALIEQAETTSARVIMSGVRSEILAGYTLRAALDCHPATFPMTYRATVAAGEKSGELATVMMQLADFLERRHALRQKTLQALLYPAIVTVVALLVIVGLMTYVVPQVVVVFQQGKQALPPLTRGLIALSAFLRQWGLALLLTAALALVLARLALRRDEVRRRWDAWLLGLPVLGRHLRTLETTRFAGTLAILVGSGVPLLSALDAGRQVLSRLPLVDAVATAADRVREGQTLATALAGTRQFPALLVHMIANGEATGRLDQLLERAAHLQQADAENRTLFITTLLEPVLLLTMGGIVLLIVLAVMQPIIELNHLLH
jgi:general secretion pathway protein F